MTHDPLLNQYQRNAVVVRLQGAEQVFREALTELTDQNEGILYRRVGTLSDEQRQQVLQLIEAALNEIAYLADKLALPIQLQNNRASVMGKLTMLSVDLYEIQAKKLVSYGAVAPGLHDVMDPSLERLLVLTDQLRATLVNGAHKPQER